MPSVDAGTALQRGEQIHKSAQALGLGTDSSGENLLGLGIIETSPEEDFGDAVSRAAGLAAGCHEAGHEPVCLVAGTTSD